jgi:hypothetical protein
VQMKIEFVAIILLSAATIAWAEPKADHSQLAAQVEGALEKCDWKVRTSTGGPKGLMLLHQAKMRRILDELKAGQSVDQNELAQVMKGHSS